uniref:Uncharacterized protein n=1 Tax=Acrobeloides nanus TaxID=290746 RepID=A0A914E7Y1_9BILA
MMSLRDFGCIIFICLLFQHACDAQCELSQNFALQPQAQFLASNQPQSIGPLAQQPNPQNQTTTKFEQFVQQLNELRSRFPNCCIKAQYHRLRIPFPGTIGGASTTSPNATTAQPTTSTNKTIYEKKQENAEILAIEDLQYKALKLRTNAQFLFSLETIDLDPPAKSEKYNQAITKLKDIALQPPKNIEPELMRIRSDLQILNNLPNSWLSSSLLFMRRKNVICHEIKNYLKAINYLRKNIDSAIKEYHGLTPEKLIPVQREKADLNKKKIDQVNDFIQQLPRSVDFCDKY